MAQKPNSAKGAGSHLHWKRRLATWWDDNLWIIIGGLGLLTFVLGLIGFKQAKANSGFSWLDIVYSTLQLFSLGAGVPGGQKPLPLEIARFLAPLITISAALKVVTILIHNRIQMLRVGRFKNHSVICGLGEKGKRLALDLTGQKERVVVIESDPGNSDIDICRDRGAIVLIGDAANPEMLEKAGVTRAKSLFAVCVDDWTNLEIALSAQKLANMGYDGTPMPGSQKEEKPCRCYVHIVDPDLKDKVIGQQEASGSRGRFAFKPFNMFENAAQELFRNHPPDVTASERNHETVHLLLIGFGQMGKTVALYAARIGHYKNGGKIRISVVDKNAEKEKGLFLYKYPSIGNICDIAFWEYDIDDIPFLKGDFRTNIGGAESVTQTIICLEQETEALRCLIALMPFFSGTQCPLLVRLNVESAFFTVLQNTGLKGRVTIFPYGLVEHCSSTEMVIDEKQNEKAKKVHEAYIKLKKQSPETNMDDPSLAPWDELSEDLKASNRQQTEHMDIKLWAINCRSADLNEPGEPVSKFDEETEVEPLAEMEHSRWNAERFLAGWKLCKVHEKSVEKKLSPYLKNWDQLSEETKDYDRDAVRNIIGTLDGMKKKVVRVGRGRREDK